MGFRRVAGSGLGKGLRLLLKRFRWTFWGLASGLALWAVALMLDLDFFEEASQMFAFAEQFQLDELLVGGACLLSGFLADLMSHKRRREREVELQAQRIHVLKVTVRTVQDVFGNFLNSLNFFLIEAEEASRWDPEILQEMRTRIQETSLRMRELGELEDAPEKELARGVSVLDLESARHRALAPSAVEKD